METDAPRYSWRMTPGAEPGAVKAASPVLNGEDEETGRKALRLVLTQPGFQRQVKRSVGRLRRKARGETASMQKDWRDLTYLLHGTATQQAAYQALETLRVFALLSPFDPMLAGTIPLDIDIPGSDLDIVCCAADVDAFAQHLHNPFGQCDTFGLQHTIIDGLPTVIGQCTSQGFPIEIFGQPRPVTEQNAVRHMIVEERL